MKAMLEMQAMETVLGNLPNGSLAAARRAALKQLERDGLPGTRHEDWKYTDLTSVIELSNAWANAGGNVEEVADAAVAAVTDQLEIDWLVFRNGVIDPASVAWVNRKGVAVSLLSDTAEIPRLAGALSEFNAALLTDGIKISVTAEHDNANPIGLLYIDSASAAVGVSQSRVIIDVAADSRASFVEYHVSSGKEAHYANSVFHCALGQSGRVNYVRLQDRAAGHSQTNLFETTLAAHSEFNHAAFDFGGQLVRNDLNIHIDGPEARAAFAGLYLADGQQHIDNHTRIDHKVGPARSDQEYRGILSGAARCVWNGKAMVHEGADGTDANQANHNLLLSERSEVDAKPELEIYADDVKCSHGTTIGQLDDTALFYLRTRGIDDATARQLLTKAFAQRIVDQSPITLLQPLIGELLTRKLGELVAGETL